MRRRALMASGYGFGNRHYAAERVLLRDVSTADELRTAIALVYALNLEAPSSSPPPTHQSPTTHYSHHHKRNNISKSNIKRNDKSKRDKNGNSTNN